MTTLVTTGKNVNINQIKTKVSHAPGVFSCQQNCKISYFGVSCAQISFKGDLKFKILNFKR
jgi:hypothetical protein